MAPRVHVLRNLQVREGSLVDVGANPGATVEFFKRHDITAEESSMSEFDTVLKSLNLTDEVRARIINEHTALIAKASKVEPVAKVVEPVQTDIEKRLTLEVDVLRKSLQTEVEKREVAEFTDIAKAYKHLGVSSTDLGAMLRAVSKLDTKVGDISIAAAFTRLIKAADAQLAIAPITGEVGTGRADGAGLTAMGEIERAAAALMVADAKLTKFSAISKVLDTRSDLYKAYESEKN